MHAPAWSTQQLAEFLAAVSSSQTEAAAARAAVERAAEALDAEVAAIVCGGQVVSVVGYPDGAAPVGELESVRPGVAGGELVIPGAGPCPATAVELEHPPRATFVLARSGAGGLSPEESGLLRGMARVASMTMRMLRLLDDERAAREEVEQLADSQAALRRVATRVARGVPPAVALSAVAEEVGRLLGAETTTMLRFEADGTATVVAVHGVRGDELPPGSRWEIDPSLATASVLRTGRSARIDDYSTASGPLAEVLQREGVRSAVATPILVEGRIWGVIGVWSRREPFGVDAEQRMWAFTELVAMAISNAEALTEVRRLADGQAALRRVATLVARESPPDVILSAVVEELGKLLCVDCASLVRFEDDEVVSVRASWGRLAEAIPVGADGPAHEASVVATLRRTGRAFRVDDYVVPRVHAEAFARQTSAGPATLPQEWRIRSVVGTPIVVRGTLWGAAVVFSQDELLPVDTQERIGEFTELVATAIANVEARSELAASRARIVEAADEQRRRVVRDLHDGAQARLVQTVMTLEAARTTDEPAEVRQLLDDGLVRARAAIEELGELVRGIHPPVLTNRGLAAAVKVIADRATVPVEVAIPTERYPPPVEVAAYFVVSEALTNVAKYARASRVRVEATRTLGRLRLVIEDDGVGGARPQAGRGLAGLRDRVDALDGVLAIDSPPGAGTRVTAEIPLAH
jgi:signal transduction histidine kinase